MSEKGGKIEGEPELYTKIYTKIVGGLELSWTSCPAYAEFGRWLYERFPSLFSGQLEERFPSHFTSLELLSAASTDVAQPPVETPAAEMDKVISQISEEYARRCKAMDSSHLHNDRVYVDNPRCIHDRFQSAIEAVLKKKESLQNSEMKTLHEKLTQKDVAEAALRRKIKALSDKAEAAERALREKDEATKKALRERDEALRKKGEEVEEAYRVFRKVVGGSATPQRTSDMPSRSPGVAAGKPSDFDSYRPPMGGPPRRGPSAYELDQAAKDRSFFKKLGEEQVDPGAYSD